LELENLKWFLLIIDWIITYGWNKIVEHEPLTEPARNDLSVECFRKESKNYWEKWIKSKIIFNKFLLHSIILWLVFEPKNSEMDP
jgi:hypothetical protein